ncbi:hypothetical protein F2P56_004948 [Juglans regia]|uniref:Uncharacterized protein n=1 Tax=Juglans regia TaxID=51240 RepID=A0A834D6Q8_JUGRE|nr:hypothetical protein F2P56_004948 [Juglans regia]
MPYPLSPSHSFRSDLSLHFLSFSLLKTSTETTHSAGSIACSLASTGLNFVFPSLCFGNGGGTDMDDAADEQPEAGDRRKRPSAGHSCDPTGGCSQQQHELVLLFLLA